MNSVIKYASYILAHAPNILLEGGSTQMMERAANPDSDYLKELPAHLRSYEAARDYLPNQTYIGNLTPEELGAAAQPWHDLPAAPAGRYGAFGEIMPEDEFYLMLLVCDAFELVWLERDFLERTKAKLDGDPAIPAGFFANIKDGVSPEALAEQVEKEAAAGLRFEGRLVGCVRRAHDMDPNLSAHVILENLASKASSALAILHLLKNSGLDAGAVDYVIDCGEEACGDMNQRGGCNLAKAAAEVAGLVSATGSDVRAFCAAPAHAMISGAALVKSGAFKNVIVTAGGCVAKLGMNGRDHVKKGLPILEDVIGGFAVLISENDGISPEINTDILGRHKVGTGSSPQNVITALVAEPLERAGLKITDVDKYSAELQNPDITKPAGAGDVPLANYKMIGALAVKRGELAKAELAAFPERRGLPGWAPTQGHIPSGVPYLGFCCQDILAGRIQRAMIIGKGSMFLGRMTNLFDGVSFIVQSNQRIGSGGLPLALCAAASELDPAEAARGAAMAAAKGLDVVLIGQGKGQGFSRVPAADEEEGRRIMEELLAAGKVKGAVTMHYPFPIGVTTVGRVITPARGRVMYIAATTGTSATNRVEAMVRNAVCGVIAAKACGLACPRVGIANIDGARQTEKLLRRLAAGGYPLSFAESGRADGGCLMRGNDILTGAADVLVCDSLTGNLIIKMLAAFQSGGDYEAVGWGYGPGIGRDFQPLIMIASRASGAGVLAGALEYARELLDGDYRAVAAREFTLADEAGLERLLAEARGAAAAAGMAGAFADAAEAGRGAADGAQALGGSACQASLAAGTAAAFAAPEKEVVDFGISGVEIMELDEAVERLFAAGIYGESAMGCTGPVIMINSRNKEAAIGVLRQAGMLEA